MFYPNFKTDTRLFLLKVKNAVPSCKILRMNPCLRLLLVFGICLAFSVELHSQELTAQQKERQKEHINQSPRLFVYDSTYLVSLEAERENFLRTKVLLDCLDISDKKREKLLRDLYKHGRSKRLNKILLAATTFEDEPEAHDPEDDK